MAVTKFPAEPRLRQSVPDIIVVSLSDPTFPGSLPCWTLSLVARLVPGTIIRCQKV
jgi:hypothetical protein